MTIHIQQATEYLKRGGVILYPTDTIWGLGCDATSEAAIGKVIAIKQRPKEKNLIVLVDSVEMLKQYVDVHPEIEKLVSGFDIPTTVIYDNPHGLPAFLVSEVNTIAVRITKHPFCNELIKAFGKPLVSTSANISGEPNPVYFDEITEAVKSKVDFIVPVEYDTSEYRQPSRLIKIMPDNTIDFLR